MAEERDALMDKALRLEESGNYAEAKETARKILEKDPNFPLAYLLLGRCEMEAKNNDGATVHFIRVHELAPNNLEALENLSRIFLLKDNLAKAEEYATKAFALSPASTEVKIIRAGIFMRKKDYVQAKPLLEDVLKADPNNEEALIGLATIAINAGDMEKAKELLKNALSKQQTPSSAVLSMLLNVAVQQQDLASAEGYTKRLIEINPKDELLPLQLYNLYMAAGKKQEAPQMLQDYLQKNPAATAVRGRLAELSLTRGNLAEAMEMLNKAPENTPAIRLLRASVLTHAGKVDEAIPALREIINDPKTDAENLETARIGLANIFMQLNRFDEAEQELGFLIANDPKNARALFMRGGLYFTQKKYDKALADLELVAKLEPDDPAAQLGLADAYNASGNHEQAEKIILHIIQQYPQYAQAYTTLANLHMMRNKPDAALMALSIGKKAIPDDSEIPLAEADILSGLKRYDEAKAVLDKLAATKEHRVVALLALGRIELSQGNYTAAAKTYNTLIKEAPDNAEAVEGYIQALVLGKKPKEALSFTEQRAQSRPDDPMAAYLYAETALLNNEQAKGEKAFLRALELDPLWEQPLTRLAQIYTASKRLNAAVTLAQSQLQKHPDALAPAVLLGILLEQKGDLSAAEAQYRQILDKHKNNLLASNNLSYLLSRYKTTPERLKEAEELATLATSSGAPATFDTLGWVQYLQGKNADAEQNVRKALESIKDNPTISYHLAAILAASGDQKKLEEAEKILTPIIANRTDFPQSEEAQGLLKKLKAKQ